MKGKIFLLAVFIGRICGLSPAIAQPLYNAVIDVQHYDFSLRLNDTDNIIKGEATIQLILRQNSQAISFDLVSENEPGKGMHVSGVSSAGTKMTFLQANDKLEIQLPAMKRQGDTLVFFISYQGIPADGLVFSKNKFKQRTIFADNWPNRACYWLPCVDHLSDKASVDFMITAPGHYRVISNGELVEESALANGLKFTHWRETVALPTKVMVIGLADFAVNNAGTVDCIPVSSWVFTGDRVNGFYDYAQALEILPFFIKTIGPYPYKKLANVEAITIFGGMENAAAIFYNERSITGKRGSSEELMAHEIAHQWFGNSATESGWPHVWLSEGFATAMTNFYLEQKYGADSLQARLRADRQTIFAFEKRRFTPVVDSSENENLLQLLNHNSYEKGGWVLYMLRRKLGDDLFWKAIRNYYQLYAGKNASTNDFQKVMETTSGTDLQAFFQQWLYQPGHPTLLINWRYDAARQKVIVKITQQQEGLYALPLQLGFKIAGESKLAAQTINLTEKVTSVELAVTARPVALEADPFCNLLLEAIVTQQ